MRKEEEKIKRVIATAIIVLFALPMFQVSALVNVTNEPAVSQTETSQDVLIINDAHKLAYFGWYMASEMPSTGWDLLNSSLVWATSYILQNETKIVFFTLDGTVTPEPGNEDAAAVYDWLGSAGYMIENIELHPIGDAGTLPSTYYEGFDLVLYWNVEGVDSTNIVASGVPFITVSAPQSADMEIGTGMYTSYEEKDVFHVVNNNYYPTQKYALGPLLFESAIGADATEATTHGKVLVKAEVESVGPQVEMSLMQDIEVSDDGSANMTFTLNILEGPLTEMYLESFFTEPPIDPGVEVPMPENKTEPVTAELEEDVVDKSLTGDINGDGATDIADIVIAALAFGTQPGNLKWNPDADLNPDHLIDIVDLVIIGVNFGGERPPPPQVTLPVKEVFHQGVVIEQAVLLGFETLIDNTKILPRGVNNETRISLKSHSPQLAKLEESIWRIKVGPQDETAANASGEFTETKIQYIQQCLRGLPGDQVQLIDWAIRIKLPPEADFLNMEALDGLNWTIDFGGGSYMESKLTATEKEVVVDEKMKVTEYEMTATEEYLKTAFSQYKAFKIEYNLGSSPAQIESVKEPCTLGEDWERTFTYTIGYGSYTLKWPPPGTTSSLTARVTLTPKIPISWYVGWHFHTFRLQWFRTEVTVNPSIRVSAFASATAKLHETWGVNLMTFSIPFAFQYSWFVRVWGHVKLAVTAGIDAYADGKSSVTTSVTATAGFNAGVKWIRDQGWSEIWSRWGAGSKTGPTITATAAAWMNAWGGCRLALMFYDVAGPWVQATAFAWISTSYIPPNYSWSIHLGLNEQAGVTITGWLRKILGLSGWSTGVRTEWLAHWQWPPP
ncbi:MAG: hypothetical protein OEW95_07525 [Candidatus Bathyarchaeota archaeon]|nr:hypothetical protein [Candidatus Bathyarchaeota archaeon]